MREESQINIVYQHKEFMDQVQSRGLNNLPASLYIYIQTTDILKSTYFFKKIVGDVHNRNINLNTVPYV